MEWQISVPGNTPLPLDELVRTLMLSDYLAGPGAVTCKLHVDDQTLDLGPMSGRAEGAGVLEPLRIAQKLAEILRRIDFPQDTEVVPHELVQVERQIDGLWRVLFSRDLHVEATLGLEVVPDQVGDYLVGMPWLLQIPAGGRHLVFMIGLLGTPKLLAERGEQQPDVALSNVTAQVLFFHEESQPPDRRLLAQKYYTRCRSRLRELGAATVTLPSVVEGLLEYDTWPE